jgi:hypothetical protein
MPLSTLNPTTADRVLLAAVRFGLVQPVSEARKLHCQPIYDGAYEVGRFVFETHAHDTGCHVDVWAFDESGSALKIVNATFWYSTAYTHNKDTFVTGAALDAFYETLSELLEKVDSAAAAKKAKEEAQKAERDAIEKAKVDALNASFKPSDDEPNPERFYKWVLELEVNETWIADGFNMTEKRWKDWAADGLSRLNANEFRARVVHAPSPESIAKAQGVTA